MKVKGGNENLDEGKKFRGRNENLEGELKVHRKEGKFRGKKESVQIGMKN